MLGKYCWSMNPYNSPNKCSIFCKSVHNNHLSHITWFSIQSSFFLKLCCFYIVSTLFYIWTLFNLIIRVGINHYSKALNCVNSLNDSLHTLVSQAVLTCMIQLKKMQGLHFTVYFWRKSWVSFKVSLTLACVWLMSS